MSRLIRFSLVKIDRFTSDETLAEVRRASPEPEQRAAAAAEIARRVPKYDAAGRERGACGHQHESIALAFACARLDWAAAEAEGDRSDRDVQRCDRRMLSEAECLELAKLEEAL